MHARTKLLGAALAATLLLALGASTATASRSFSVVGGGRAILAIASGETRLTFRGNTGIDVIQLVTLHGSIHGSIAKTEGSLVGAITNVLVGAEAECRSNIGGNCQTIMLIPALSWHLRLLFYTGTLPSITSIKIEMIELEVTVRLGTTECLFRGALRFTGTARAEPRDATISQLRVDETRQIRLFRTIRDEPLRPCAMEGAVAGTFNLALLTTVRLA